MCGLSGPVLPPLNGKTGRIFSRARGIHFFQQRCSRCTVQTDAGLKAEKALLLAPTFADYEKALRSVGCGIDYYLLQEENNFEPQSDILRQLTPDIDLWLSATPIILPANLLIKNF